MSIQDVKSALNEVSLLLTFYDGQELHLDCLNAADKLDSISKALRAISKKEERKAAEANALRSISASTGYSQEELQVFENIESTGFVIMLPTREEYHFTASGQLINFSRPVAA